MEREATEVPEKEYTRNRMDQIPSKKKGSNHMHFRKQLQSRDGPPRGDPGLGILNALSWLPVLPSSRVFPRPPWPPVAWPPVAGTQSFVNLRTD